MGLTPEMPTFFLLGQVGSRPWIVLRDMLLLSTALPVLNPLLTFLTTMGRESQLPFNLHITNRQALLCSTMADCFLLGPI